MPTNHKNAKPRSLRSKAGAAPAAPRPQIAATTAATPASHPVQIAATPPAASHPSPLPTRSSNPHSAISNPQSPHLALPPSQEDRARLTHLFRAQGDFVNFIGLIGEHDPLELLAWLARPDIKPWADHISQIYRTHREAAVQTNLARALKEVTRILDLEADSTIRIRAVNNIIRLANAIDRSHRATENRQLHSPTAAHRSRAEARANKEHHHANEARLNTEAMLDINQRRRAQNEIDLQDANAPVGAFPSWARDLAPIDNTHSFNDPHGSHPTSEPSQTSKPHHLALHLRNRTPQGTITLARDTETS